MILTNSCKKVLNNFIQQYTIIENQRINLHALSMFASEWEFIQGFSSFLAYLQLNEESCKQADATEQKYTTGYFPCRSSS